MWMAESTSFGALPIVVESSTEVHGADFRDLFRPVPGLLPTPRSVETVPLLLGLNGSIIAAVGMATSMGLRWARAMLGWGHHVRRSIRQSASGLGVGMLALAWRSTRTRPAPTLVPSVAIVIALPQWAGRR
jgi:hypothetical protein